MKIPHTNLLGIMFSVIFENEKYKKKIWGIRSLFKCFPNSFDKYPYVGFIIQVLNEILPNFVAVVRLLLI